MKISFNFISTPDIYFGVGKRNLLPEIIKKYGSPVLLLIDKTLSLSDMFHNIEKEITSVLIKYYYETVSHEPSPKDIDNITENYRKRSIQTIVAVGGGSVLDTGKAVSAMLKKQDSVIHYLEGISTKSHDGLKIPFIAVPTTAGTGSECTKNAVLSDVGEKGFKRSLRNENFVPYVAIVYPELTLTCPHEITASCGMDAFTQLMEAYTSVKAFPLTDSICETALQYISSSLLKSFFNPDDIVARSQMAYAAMISGISLANAGLGAVHGIAAAIGGFFNIPHSVICGSAMAPCNKISLTKILNNDPANPVLEKLVNAGRYFSAEKNNCSIFYANSFIETLYSLTETLKIPKLGQFGIKNSDIDKIISATDLKCHPVKLDAEDIKKIIMEII
ncbi:MAG: iron-containing alcohol dehydrogenase [Bacteroidia bacterium]|nr:iron-containing alcohol dehydrogenase [Bacteroidia bacterium]